MNVPGEQPVISYPHGRGLGPEVYFSCETAAAERRNSMLLVVVDVNQRSHIRTLEKVPLEKGQYNRYVPGCVGRNIERMPEILAFGQKHANGGGKPEKGQQNLKNGTVQGVNSSAAGAFQHDPEVN